MKSAKRLLYTIVILLIILTAGYLWLNKGSNYQSVYLVPEDALLIAESNNVSKSISTITSSDIWEYLKTNKNLAEVQKTFVSIDSLLTESKWLLKLVASRKVQISLHPLGNKQAILAVVDLNKLGSLKNIDKKLPQLLGDDFTVSSRMYRDDKIIELLSLEDSEMYYLTILKGKLLFSYTHSMIEKAIDQQNKMIIGRDLNFIEINKHLSGKGLVNVIIPVQNWNTQANNPFETENEMLTETYKSVSYLGALLEIENDTKLKLQTLVNINDTSTSFGNVLLKSGVGKTEVEAVTPNRAASMLTITFSSFSEFYTNLIATLPETEQQSIAETIEKTNKKLKIDVNENLFGWIDNEIGFLQTQPSNLGKRNEFAFVLKAKKEKQARKNLDFINEQIRKNTPVKFKHLAYQGFEIQYLTVGPLLKTLFGNLINRLEKPYYTIIDKYVIFSNHPQTLKNIIDDYNNKGTLAFDAEYYNFKKQYNRNMCMFTFVNTEILYNNLQHMVAPELWKTISKNKDYIVCFNNIGFEINELDGLLQMNMTADFAPEVEISIPVIYQQASLKQLPEIEVTKIPQEKVNLVLPEDTLEAFQSKIIIHDLDNKQQEEYYNNNNLKFEVDLKHGLKHGTFKEYYQNGELKIKGKYENDKRTGVWKYYNHKGKLVLEKEYE